MSNTLDEDIIVIDDNYTGDIKYSYQIAGEIMEETVREYISILRELLQKEGIRGKAADKIEEFTELTEKLLGGVIEELIQQITVQMREFVEEIDRADAEIY